MEKKHAKFRHEYKYLLNYSEYASMSQRLCAILPSDPNVGRDGEYFIRSLYFDDPDDSALREKLGGSDNRDKFRIRIYNLKKDVIKLERKRKVAGYIIKDSLSLSYRECMSLIAGDYSFLQYRDEPFARAMFIEFSTRILKPKVIVDYVREPYVFPYDDVRITFDKDIRTAYRATDLFSRTMPTYPVLEPGYTVLEVKFNSAMPSSVASLIQTNAPIRSAVSKYVLCRKYEL